MNLLQLAHLYLSTRVGISQRYRRELLAVARRCTRELGQVNSHLPTQTELARWLQSLIDSGRSPATAAAYQRMLRAWLAPGSCTRSYESMGWVTGKGSRAENSAARPIPQ